MSVYIDLFSSVEMEDIVMKKKLKFSALLLAVALTLNVSCKEGQTSEPIMVYAQDVSEETVVSDPEFSKQWALYNDGSFYIEDQQEEFPVYENPFDEPVNRGNVPEMRQQRP